MKCPFCKKEIKLSQPTLMVDTSHKEDKETIAHEACVERRFNEKEAYKKWDFKTFQRRKK